MTTTIATTKTIDIAQNGAEIFVPLDRLKKSQRLAMRTTMQLREINLATFPDWSQPPEAQLQQMRAICNALAAHPPPSLGWRFGFFEAKGHDNGKYKSQPGTYANSNMTRLFRFPSVTIRVNPWSLITT